MKKLLLIIALTLLWSFSANAQIERATKKISKDIIRADEVLSEPSNPNCRTHFTPPEAYESTADGNVNTYKATYSTVTTRNCERPANTPVSQGGAGCGAGNPECMVWAN